MGFCSNCGAQTNDASAFCMNCGASLSGASANSSMSQTGTWGATQTQSASMGGWSQPSQFQGYSAQPASPAIGALKRIAASPLFLIATILVSLQLLMQIISTFAVGGNAMLWSALNYVDYYLDLDFGPLVMLISVLALVPPILTTVGLWLAYAAGLNKRSGGYSTTGLTMVKVIYIIMFVFECIAYALAVIGVLGSLIGSLSMASRYSSYGYGYSDAYATGFSIGLILGMMILIAVIVLRIFWYIKINQSINAAKYTASTGNGVAGASSYVGVFCFIGAVLQLILFFYTISVAGAYIDALTIITTLCAIATPILFGIIIFTYRSSMQRLAVTPMPLNTVTINNICGYMPQQPTMNTQNTMNTSYPTSETPYVSPMNNTGSFSNWDNTSN